MDMRSQLLLSCACLTVFGCVSLSTNSVVPAGFSRLIGESTSTPLEGWSTLGKATFYTSFGDVDSKEDSSTTLIGKAENMQLNSFLVSDAEYSDFELLVGVRIEPGGNSGIQIRSHVDWEAQSGHGRLWGYQIEIDPSDRAWSAGLFDEGRRGWLANLEENPEARAAFVVGEWNEFRILCEGARIRTWVNGVAAVDFVDEGEDLDLTGCLAFQVHNGKSSDVQWRDPVIREL